MQKHFYLLLFILSFYNCATYQTQYSKGAKSSTVTTSSEIEHSFYLIGDAGLKETQNIVLNDVAQGLDTIGKNSTLIFLGDNIYFWGMPKKEHPDRKQKEAIIDAQIELAKKFPGNSFFMPGNHDWYSGLSGVHRQQKYVEKDLGKDSFLPEDGCGFKSIKIGDDIVLIIIDSQWYITNWNRHPQMNDKCDIKTKKMFWEEVESEIKKADGKTTLIAMHNPVLTDGTHGGQYAIKSYLTPIPILGNVKNLIRKTGGISNTDDQNVLYRELSDRLKAYSQFGSKVIFVSGHDHNLQYIVRDNVIQVISGSGAKKNPTRLRTGGKFSTSDHGYARIDVLKDGSSQVHFFSSEKKKELYNTEVFPQSTPLNTNNFGEIPPTKAAKIYEDDATKKSGFYTFLWGARYRNHYSTEVTVPAVNLSEFLGGLTPKRKGGGHQSKSLHLQNKDEKEYVMRALKKSATQFIQAVGFKDQYVINDFADTDTEDLILDVFTGAHPYAPFTIDKLSEAINVYHTNPTLVYIPKQQALEKYNDEFGDELYMIEEKVTDGHGNLESFGNADEVISTYKVFEKIRKDEDNQVDQKAFLRARLFDMVLGDWDRHNDQWKWAVKEDGKKETYIPIPRDRDQVFSKMSDGLIMGYLTRAIPSLGLMQDYTAKPRNIKKFNLEPYPLDVAFLQDMTLEDWEKEISFIQTHLTDKVIEDALNQMPHEVKDESFNTIIKTLKKRRDNLSDYDKNYFKVVNKIATINGTDKDDYFEINRLEDGSTEVTVYRIKKGKKKDKFHHKIFHPEYTKEIWLYGLDDDDVFHVFGEGDAKIKVRIIGGQNHDVYNIENGEKVVVYDYKTKKSTFKTDKGKVKLTDDYFTNVYDYHKLKYNELVSAFPAFGYNPDNGIMIGPSISYTINNFERNPFSQKHKAQIKYFTATEGVEVNYLGEFARILGNENLLIDFLYQSPFYSKNFFGYGMKSLYDSDRKLDYYRTLVEEFHLNPSIIFRGSYGQSYQAGITFQSMEIDKIKDRYIYQSGLIPESAFTDNQLLGVFGNFTFENKDNNVFPTLAMLFKIDLGYTANLSDDSKSYAYINPSLGFSQRLTYKGNIVLSTLFNSQFNSKEDLEFYQMASIGGNNGLRGFYNQRFAGKSSYTQSTDLRFQIDKVKTALVPISYGVFVGFDYGRVWSKYDASNIWKTSYGGGIFINGAESIGLNASYFFSEDGGRFSIGSGFKF